jgi:alpha-tubulin suppressor-like RCC1 family protein
MNYSKLYVTIQSLKNYFISNKYSTTNSLALTQNREVYAWGNNGYGQLGNGSNENQVVPIKLDCLRCEGEVVIEVSHGFVHSLALTEKGHVFSLGNNSFGQLGHWYKKVQINQKSLI